MKKVLVVLVIVSIGFIFGGCAAKTYCYIKYPDEPVTVGSVMLTKWKCFGRVTVNQCPEQEVMEIVYLGRTHSGEHIRIGSRVGSSTQFIAEATYPTSLKAINFQEAEFKEIKSDFNSITFTIDIDKLKSQCNRVWVNSQEVK